MIIHILLENKVSLYKINICICSLKMLFFFFFQSKMVSMLLLNKLF